MNGAPERWENFSILRIDYLNRTYNFWKPQTTERRIDLVFLCEMVGWNNGCR
jgi:hypothetical protein